jgi:hypothetical protein
MDDRARETSLSADTCVPCRLSNVDAMAPFDFPVLLWAAPPDVSMTNPGGLDRERKGEWEFATVVTLQLADAKRERTPHLAEEVQARMLVLTPIPTQDA